MKTVALFLLFSFCTSLRAQEPKFSALKLFAGSSADHGASIHIDALNNYYLTGDFLTGWDTRNDSLVVDCQTYYSSLAKTFTGFLFRYDSARNLTLALTIPTGRPGEVAVDPSGSMYVSGLFSFGFHGDGFLRKYDPDGTVLWTRVLQSQTNGYPGDDVISSVTRSPDGSLLFTGSSQGQQVSFANRTLSGPVNFIGKLDPRGNLLWWQPVSTALGMGASKVHVDRHGDILLAGREGTDTAIATSALVAKHSGATGQQIWKRTFAPSVQYLPAAAAIASSGDRYVFGGSFGEALQAGNDLHRSKGHLDVFLLQTDTAGNVQWSVTGGSPARDMLRGVTIGPDGTLYATGGFSDGFTLGPHALSAKGNLDVFVLALDSTGRPLWARTGGSSLTGHTDEPLYDETGGQVVVDQKGSIHVAGTTIGSGQFGSLTFKAPESAEQNAFWLTLGPTESQQNTTFPCSATGEGLQLQVYPNPYFSQLVVTNSRMAVLQYEVHLYNTLGQLLGRRRFTAAHQTLTDWTYLPAGVYYLKVRAGGLSQTFRLVKID
ncbi:MAG TPA: T9SS type A sorting domain-containing protein [Chitinophagaceae bacterium]|jgi:outer membrane protein assembly factor BamB|nr:T9SS type A sorting domain-containing protein [Chitinophagaceae bacterium]